MKTAIPFSDKYQQYIVILTWHIHYFKTPVDNENVYCYTTLTFALKPKVSSLVCLSVRMSGMASVTKDTNSSTFP